MFLYFVAINYYIIFLNSRKYYKDWKHETLTLHRSISNNDYKPRFRQKGFIDSNLFYSEKNISNIF